MSNTDTPSISHENLSKDDGSNTAKRESFDSSHQETNKTLPSTREGGNDSESFNPSHFKKPKKMIEITEVHSMKGNSTELKEKDNKLNLIKQKKNVVEKSNLEAQEKTIQSKKEVISKIDSNKIENEVNDISPDTHMVQGKKICEDDNSLNKDGKNQHFNVMNTAQLDSINMVTSQHSQSKTTHKTNLTKLNSNCDSEALDNVEKSKEEMKLSLTKSLAPLPDILSVISKSLPMTSQAPDKDTTTGDKLKKIYLGDQDHENDNLKSKSLSSQFRILPNLYSTDILHSETDTDLKRLNYLQSLPTNQSIYKLAYDESLTDQSEVDSRSPSPIDPESQVPSSLTNAEILIHEASDSDAGSEDVELIPHRYESETFLNGNKHMYVNKLSLAVELLRTQETLPYDDEFKRVGENHGGNLKKIQPDKSGKINFGFVDDCSSIENSIALESFSSETTKSFNKQTGITREPQLVRQCAIISHSSADDSCEVAKEAIAPTSENQDSTEEVKAEYRRFGVQARHYLSPRASIVNPCFCCIIM